MESTTKVQLDDASRTKLDGIVMKMASQNAPKEDVQAVVEDFKSKYGKAPEAPATPQGNNSLFPTIGNEGLAKAAGPDLKTVAMNIPGSQLFKDVGTSLGGMYQGIKGGVQKLIGNDAGASKSFGKYQEAVNKIDPVKDFGSGANLALTAATPITGGASTALGRIGTGAAFGAGIGAASATSKGKPFSEVATDTVVGGALGGALSGLGEAVSLAKNGNIEQSSTIMNRVARITPSDANKFKEIAGMSHGEYLAKSGNFGTPEKIIEKEAAKFVNSLDQVDSAIAQLPGTYHAEPVTSALEELVARKTRVSAPGAPSPDLDRALKLLKKSEKDGLTMAEINQVKRLYERNVKLGYNKLMNADAVARATNIDNAMRNWQFNQAENLGLKNLPELNKQTRISKALINYLGKQVTGKTGNDAVNLTDWIMLSHGNPQAIAGFITKKTLSSKVVQSGIAKRLAGSPTIESLGAKLEPTAENMFRKVSPTGAKLLSAPLKGASRSSLSSGEAIRVAPKGVNLEMTSKNGVIPSKPTKLLKPGK